VWVGTQIVGTRIALALEQCTLHKENARNAEYKTALKSFIRFLAGEDVDGDGEVSQMEIMVELAPLMRDILSADHVTILLVDESTQLLWGVSVTND
jgi:hypothetical protein